MHRLADETESITEVDSRARYAGFTGSMLQNVGFSFSDISKTPIMDIDKNFAAETYARKIQEYKDRLLN